MLTLSKPISAGQAQAYHKSEFANAKENYYTEGERVRGEWQGQLAARYGLRGEVNEEQFARLSEGQHPATGEALIRRQQAREYINDKGETTRTMEHRAGWDATFSAPKSVSLTALVGGDNRVREAHRESVRVALDEMERYAQARIGGNAVAQTTGAWADGNKMRRALEVLAKNSTREERMQSARPEPELPKAAAKKAPGEEL